MPLAVCATPIGNLDDVTLRVLAELREADLVLCEDTRRTRILLDRHGIQAAGLVSYHRHNEAAREAEVLSRLGRGERVALVSDAGLPGVNDPGARLVRAAAAAGLPVTVLPGASAVETALVASGVEADRYQFVGYLPRRAGELRELARALVSWPGAVVAFESPRRLPASLAVLAEEMAERPAAVCRELTKRFEEVARGTVAELADRFAEAPPGEVTLVLGPAAARPDAARVEEARSAVAELVSAGASRRTAAEVVARLTGVSKNALYRASL
jgi:16S rRNA (cytidine1402-2'-O)-methyltransferase